MTELDAGARGSGRIVNISSMTGLVANPPNAYYSSTKFALEALTEALSKEVGPLGIKVTAIEPGGFRTDWATRSMKEASAPIDAYAEGVGVELSLYLSYLDQTSPGAAPGFFGRFAWSAAKLFVEQAIKLGGELDRASLDASMRKVDGWTAGGMHAPMPVMSKQITDCWRFIQWTGSAWKPVEGAKYQCKGTIT